MTDKVRERGHDALSTWGIGKEHDKRHWQAIFRQMMGHDLMRPDPDRHGALRMTAKARPILRGEASITLRRDVLRAEKSGPKVHVLVSEADAPLLSALKAKRRALAEAASVPAYIIFTDKTLIEMAESRPSTLDAMARIGGVGAKKLESYGRAFLEVITGASAPVHPRRMKLAGRDEGAVYDRLLATQAALQRGEDGAGKVMTCTASALAKVAQAKPGDMDALTRFLGERHAEWFGAAFLEVLREG